MPASSNLGVNFPGPPSSLLEDGAGDGNGVARGTAGTAKLLRDAAGTAFVVSDAAATVLSPGAGAPSRVSFCPCWAQTGRASIALNPTVRHNLRIVVLQRLFHRNHVCYSRAHRVFRAAAGGLRQTHAACTLLLLNPVGKTPRIDGASPRGLLHKKQQSAVTTGYSTLRHFRKAFLRVAGLHLW